MNLVAGIRAQACERRAQALEVVKQRREATKQLLEQHRQAALSKVEEHKRLMEDNRKAALQLVEEYRTAATNKAEEQRDFLAKKLGLAKSDKSIETEQQQYEKRIMGAEPMNEDAYDSEGNSEQSLSDEESSSKTLTALSPSSSNNQTLSRHETKQLRKLERKETRLKKEAERKNAKLEKKAQKEETRRLKKQAKTENQKMKISEKAQRPLAICDVQRFFSFQPALAAVPEDAVAKEDPFGTDRFTEISPHLTAKSTSDMSVDSVSTLYQAPTMPRKSQSPAQEESQPPSAQQYRFATSSEDMDDKQSLYRRKTKMPSSESSRQPGQYKFAMSSDDNDEVASLYKTKTPFPMAEPAETTRDRSTSSPATATPKSYQFSSSSEDQEDSRIQRWKTPYTPQDTSEFLDVEHQRTNSTLASEAASQPMPKPKELPKSPLSQVTVATRSSDATAKSASPQAGETDNQESDAAPALVVTRTATRKPIPTTDTINAAASFTTTTPSTTAQAETGTPEVNRYLSRATAPRYLEHINQETVYEPEFDARVPQKIKTTDYARYKDKYEKAGKVVGSGAFGAVSVVRRRSDKKSLFAVKEFRGRDAKESRIEYNRRVATEFCFASALNHPNVINTIEVLRDSGKWFQIMEFAPFDLFTAVKSQKMGGEEICCVFKQMMCGVEYLHSVGLAHRDLKLENLVLDAHGIVKIIDFGSAVVFKYPHESKLYPATGFAGSEPYLAPEVLDDGEYMPASTDIWSCAIVFCCMWNKRFPWKSPCFTDKDFRVFAAEIPAEDEEQRLAALNLSKVTTGKHKIQGPWRLLRHLPAEARPVIFNMLDLEPENRAIAREVLQSRWLQRMNMCFIEDGKFTKKHEHILMPSE